MKPIVLYQGPLPPPSPLAANVTAALTALYSALPAFDTDRYEARCVNEKLVGADLEEAYSQLSIWLRSDDVAHGSIIYVLGCDFDKEKWNAIADNGWTTLVALLVLSFPEMRWIIQGRGEFDLGSAAEQAEWPLTDGSGLREFIRSATASQAGHGPARPCFPVRKECFVSLDEEQDYAFFSAYTAYRFGYSAFAPLCLKEGEKLLRSGTSALKPCGCFEDIFLQFPDQPPPKTGELPWSYLERRDATLENLAGVRCRVLVTSGGEDRIRGSKGDRERKNQHHLKKMRSRGAHVEVLGKPLGGMFGLWLGAKVDRWLARERAAWKIAHPQMSGPDSAYKRLRAPGFDWPPDGISDDAGNHSAHGRLLMVARTLLEKAEKILEDGVFSVEEAVRGAIFATDALEMLGDRTPTTAMEALAVKHQMEVVAECQFIGVNHGIAIKDRLDEIRHEIKTICRRYAASERQAAALDAEAVILGKLVGTFEEYYQFDEEMVCRYWQKRALAKLFQTRHGLIGWFPGWIWRYLNWLARTPLRFLFGIVGWLSLGTLAFSLTSGVSPTSWDWSFIAPGWAMDAFFGGNAPDLEGTWVSADSIKWIARALTVLGLFHFGVFISYVYTLISRK